MTPLALIAFMLKFFSLPELNRAVGAFEMPAFAARNEADLRVNFRAYSRRCEPATVPLL